MEAERYVLSGWIVSAVIACPARRLNVLSLQHYGSMGAISPNPGKSPNEWRYPFFNTTGKKVNPTPYQRNRIQQYPTMLF